MSTDGFDIGFFEHVNRRQSAVYATLLPAAVVGAAGAAVIARSGFDASLELSLFAATAGAVLTVAAVRATFVRRMGGRAARRVTRHCADTGITRAVLDRVVAEHDLVFVADLSRRHGARAADETTPATLAGDPSTD